MQVKIIFLTYLSDELFCDKNIFALKRIRNFVECEEVVKINFKSNFKEYFNGKVGNYLIVADINNYSHVLKSIKEIQSDNLIINVLSYDNNFDENLKKLYFIKSSCDCYKLFNVDGNLIDNLLVKFDVDYTLKNVDGDILLKIDYKGYSLEEIDKFRKIFLSEFGDKIYATQDVLPQNLLVDILKIRGAKISVAESFTGGNLSASITSVSGASCVFYEGQVVYNEMAKAARLGVKTTTLKEYKPVSKQVAYEMCLGLLKSGKCDIAISTTGIAGPNSDNSLFPVGLCYIAVGTVDKITVYKFNFKGTREEITNQGVKTALCLAIKTLL